MKGVISRFKIKTAFQLGILFMLIIPYMAPSSMALDNEMDYSLTDSSASFWGEDDGDESGDSVAGVGDVNGDGYDDILIGSPYSDDGGEGAGQSYLIFGKDSGWSMDNDLSNADASFVGENDVDLSGQIVAGAGDVNGDGFNDLLIGSPGNDEGGKDAGQTYLIFGKSSGWSMDVILSEADASFLGEFESDRSMRSIAGAGDVNSDGYDDLLIGSYKYSPQDDGQDRTEAGKTYLILGRAYGWTMDFDLSNADASFLGERAYDESGFWVAGAGDVNRDGYDDVLIGARNNDEGGNLAGQTYLIMGKNSGWTVDINLSESDASFIGEQSNDNSGYRVAGAGDVNGDGYDDILIASAGNGENGFQAGQTYMFLGKSSGWDMDTNLRDADASFWGEVANDLAGASIAGAGDVNYDGYDDILICAYGYGRFTGQTYLVLGRTFGWGMDTNLSTADAFFKGENGWDYSGFPVAMAGDVNGDGGDDILIGASLNDENGLNAGQTYVIFGTLDRDNDRVPDINDAFPVDIAASEDTDGDGFPDDWNEGKNISDSTSGLRLDAFPDDIAASLDMDGDGFPDEWNLGISANNSTSEPKLIIDKFPNDSSEWVDTDGDTYGDNGDAFPNDAAASVDSDGDGHPDEWNLGSSNKDSTTGLKLDHHPDNPEKWKKDDEAPSFSMVVTIGAIAILFLITRIRSQSHKSWL
jgi:hypothetical protein